MVIKVYPADYMSRPRDAKDQYWPDRLMTLLSNILLIQDKRYTVSMRELEEACDVSRQTIVNWLRVAEEMGYVNLHNGQPRALELLPEGRRLAKEFLGLHDVKSWHKMRHELRKQYAVE